MIGSAVSLICALILWSVIGTSDLSKMRAAFLLGGIVPLLLAFAASFSTSRLIQKNQYKTLAAGLTFYLKDRLLAGTFAALLFFFIYSLSLLAFPASLEPFLVWVFLLGVSFDLVRLCIRRSLRYLQLPFLIGKMEEELVHAIGNMDEKRAFELLSIVIEACTTAMLKKKIYVATSLLSAIQRLTEVYVQELARVELQGRLSPSGEGGPSFFDKVNYLCLYVCERLEWMNENAIRGSMRPVAIEIMTTFGRLSLFFSRHSPDLAIHPLRFLLKCAHEAQNIGEQEIVTRSILALSETCKAFIRLSQAKNQSFKGLIFECLSTMEEIVKMVYLQNKEINSALLIQPFAEIGEFMGTKQALTCPDRDEIFNALRRVFVQFQSLQMVTSNMEEVITSAQDTSSSFQEDLPFITRPDEGQGQ
ncbi:MAG: hypothetical protein JSR46_08590 [Verrucomicrobia bacterium]|nr:hypothetical protein [Verrucomicrobiota bacterium]